MKYSIIKFKKDTYYFKLHLELLIKFQKFSKSSLKKLNKKFIFQTVQFLYSTNLINQKTVFSE